jgi:hypothetical protein
MRYVLAFGLLITLCAFANAATGHHFKQRHIAVRSWGLGFAPFRRAWAYGAPSYYAAGGYGNNGDASAHGGESATHPY